MSSRAHSTPVCGRWSPGAPLPPPAVVVPPLAPSQWRRAARVSSHVPPPVHMGVGAAGRGVVSVQNQTAERASGGAGRAKCRRPHRRPHRCPVCGGAGNTVPGEIGETVGETGRETSRETGRETSRVVVEKPVWLLVPPEQPCTGQGGRAPHGGGTGLSAGKPFSLRVHLPLDPVLYCGIGYCLVNDYVLLCANSLLCAHCPPVRLLPPLPALAPRSTAY